MNRFLTWFFETPFSFLKLALSIAIGWVAILSAQYLATNVPVDIWKIILLNIFVYGIGSIFAAVIGGLLITVSGLLYALITRNF